MRTGQQGWIARAAGLIAAGLVCAGSAHGGGFAVRSRLDEDGSGHVSFGGRNVWKPLSVAVVMDTAGARTVRLTRQRAVAASVDYPVSVVTGNGTAFVYVFAGSFWFTGNEQLRVEVVPAGAGTLEVMCE